MSFPYLYFRCEINFFVYFFLLILLCLTLYFNIILFLSIIGRVLSFVFHSLYFYFLIYFYSFWLSWIIFWVINKWRLKMLVGYSRERNDVEDENLMRKIQTMAITATNCHELGCQQIDRYKLNPIHIYYCIKTKKTRKNQTRTKRVSFKNIRIA